LKEIFVAMFFIYVGSLINIDIVIKYWYIILLAAISIKIIKVISTFFACKLLKIKEKNAWTIGLNLSQVSEFSLVVIA
jgi:CPA2 family monovalent cation:H+ antiporter-2